MAGHIEDVQGELGSQALAVYNISGNYGQLTLGMCGRLFSLLQACVIQPCVDSATYYGGQRTNGGINECNEISDVINAKTIVVYGANITDAQVHHWHLIKEAQQNGTKLVVVDPTYTQLASKADLWIPIRPGSDTALYLGLMRLFVERGVVDESFMADFTVAPFLVREDTGKFLRRSDTGVAPTNTGEVNAATGEEVVGCAVCAVVCFAPRLRTTPLLVVASLLAIAGIFCKRVQLLVGGFQLPNIDYAGVMTPMTVTNWDAGMAAAYQGMVYWPTPLEFGVAAGVIALGFLIFFLGLKFLPLQPKDE